jgi:hypothetical protein
MADEQAYGRRWQEYRPSKTALFWSCVASVVVALIIGFTWGGWVTGSTATEMANRAASEARAQVAATACVQRFLDASDAREQLASLKKTNSWQRDDLISKGGWATPPGFEKPVADAADLCAEQLAAMELPPSTQNAPSGQADTPLP